MERQFTLQDYGHQKELLRQLKQARGLNITPEVREDLDYAIKQGEEMVKRLISEVLIIKE